MATMKEGPFVLEILPMLGRGAVIIQNLVPSDELDAEFECFGE
jgi:hypothetical protein